jgi:hypothetical protein
MLKFPDTLIIGTEDIIEGYLARTANEIKNADLAEIVTQVIQLLLNEESEVCPFTYCFPDFKRLINKSFLVDTETNREITEQTLHLVSLLGERLKENGVYCDNTMPYFFDSFLGKDIILKHLPY